MKTSVVIATYNGEDYIEEQLETIKDQTRVVDEVLIFDDLSQDDTALLVNDFIEKYALSNWKLVINEVNKSYSRNFTSNQQEWFRIQSSINHHQSKNELFNLKKTK